MMMGVNCSFFLSFFLRLRVHFDITYLSKSFCQTNEERHVHAVGVQSPGLLIGVINICIEIMFLNAVLHVNRLFLQNLLHALDHKQLNNHYLVESIYKLKEK